MTVKNIFLLLLLFVINVFSLKIRNFIGFNTFKNKKNCNIVLKQSSTTTTTNDNELINEKEIQKYFLINDKQRPEIFISSNNNYNEIISEIWKNILISVRILDNNNNNENNEEINDYLSVLCFPNLKINNNNDKEKYEKIASNIVDVINNSVELFQPDIVRKINFKTININNNNNQELNCFSIYSKRLASLL